MTTATEGRKNDSDKIRMELIPPELLFAVGDILSFGAKKYTWRYETEWDRLLDVKSVKSIKISTAKECVVVATKKTSEEIILTLQNDKEKTVGIGKNEILTKLRNTPDVGKLIQSAVKETERQSGKGASADSALNNKSTTDSVQRAVKSVEAPNTLTLTIVTTQGNSEEFCVRSATTGWVSWETIWKDLQERLNISKPLNQEGERNWERGMSWSRVFGAAMRHAWAWWGGKAPTTENFALGELDMETGKSHLWHLGCCVAFLIAFEERGTGTDDRWAG